MSETNLADRVDFNGLSGSNYEVPEYKPRTREDIRKVHEYYCRQIKEAQEKETQDKTFS